MPRRRRTRRAVAVDSGSSTDDSHNEIMQAQAPALTEAHRYESMRAIAMADLGTSTRDRITSVDHRGNQRVHLRALMAARDCNQEGTDAAERVANNKPSLTKWANFWDSSDAKADIVEEIPDIAAGQSHRTRGKEELRIRELQLGRPLTLEDTYDDHHRRGPITTSRLSRGGSHAAANDRGNFSGGRGGGNAGRGLGRNQVAVNMDRPLDPAVDPDRVYKYKNKASRSRILTTTMVNNTVRVTSSAPATVTRGNDKVGASNKNLGRQNNAAALTQASLPASRPSGRRPNGPKLASQEDFMAAVRKAVPAVKPPPTQSTDVTSTSTQLSQAQASLLKSKYATTPVVKAAGIQTQRLSRDEFRDPGLSPGNLTDALLSTGELSVTSPSMLSEAVAEDSAADTGLGILNADMREAGTATTIDVANDATLRKGADLMDIEVPDVQAEVLVLTPQATSPTDVMISIPKTEAEIWAEVKALLNAGDIDGLRKHLNSSSPDLTENALSLKSVTSPKHSVSIANGYVVDASKVVDLIGDKNLPKGTGTQATSSLVDSKWAPGPRSATGAKRFPAVNEATVFTVANPPSLNSNNLASTTGGDSRVNPFMPRSPSSAVGNTPLDYGEPSKIKKATATSASVLSQPHAEALLNPFTQSNSEAHWEQQRAMMGAKLQQIRHNREQAKAREDLNVQVLKTATSASGNLPNAKPLESVPKPVQPMGRSNSLLASKFADPQPALSARAMPALHDRSTNNSPQTPAERAATVSRGTVPAKLLTPIFGDSRVLRPSKAATTSSRFVNTHPRSTGLFDRPAAATTRQAHAKSNRYGFRGETDNESDESEL